MIDLLPRIDSLVPTLGYTLMHSLWLGLLIYCLLFMGLAIFKVSNSKLRYTCSVAALSVYLISTVATFFWLVNPISVQSGGVKNIQILFDKDFVTAYNFSFTTWVAQNMNIILSVWGVGVLVMLIRLLGGWYLLTRIKKNAIECSNELWVNKLELLKSRLKITANVILKLSNAVDVPMVFGTIKPIIILPTTLLTGLSDDQLEIILAHELAHVKRYDFIVNILQHMVEVVFFFNPFVWLISNLIRSERENACDDLALSVSGDSYSLASTLLRVEEIRRQPQLALHFSNNNNIFHRIKRLTGMKTQNLLDTRMVILVLFAASLMSFGWYSINSKTEQEKEEPTEEEFFEPTEVDVDVDPQSDINVEPAVVTNYEPAPVIDEKEEMIPETVLVEADTTEKDKDAWRYEKRVPPAPPALPEFPPIPPMELNEWAEAFSAKFSERFADFYEEHKDEMEKMIDELQETIHSGNLDGFEEARFMKEMALRQKELALEQRERMRFDEEHWREEAEKAMVLAKEQMQLERESMQSMREEMLKLEKEMKVFEQKMKKFDEELKNELVKDGYIKSSEDIETLDVDRDGQFKVNGVKVSDKDSKKYAEIYEKYFDNGIKGLRYHND